MNERWGRSEGLHHHRLLSSWLLGWPPRSATALGTKLGHSSWRPRFSQCLTSPAVILPSTTIWSTTQTNSTSVPNLTHFYGRGHDMPKATTLIGPKHGEQDGRFCHYPRLPKPVPPRVLDLTSLPRLTVGAEADSAHVSYFPGISNQSLSSTIWASSD